MKWFMLPRWLVSTPIRLYAHPATPESTPIGVDYASLLHALGVWLRCMPPPEPYLKRSKDRRWWSAAVLNKMSIK